MLITVLGKDNELKYVFPEGDNQLDYKRLCLVFRSAGGMYALLLRHENKTDLALLRSHAPSAGTALPRPVGNHRHHQQICHDFHWFGSSLLSGIKPSGAL